MKYIWMAVTSDEYELPIFVEESSTKLAQKLGITVGSVLSSVFKGSNGRYSGRKIVKVEYEEE